jgi:hypothetical protein
MDIYSKYFMVVITEILSANGYKNPSSPKPISSFIAPKIHFQRAQTIQLVIKWTCAKTI